MVARPFLRGCGFSEQVLSPRVDGVGTRDGGRLLLCDRESIEGTVRAFYSRGS